MICAHNLAKTRTFLESFKQRVDHSREKDIVGADNVLTAGSRAAFSGCSFTPRLFRNTQQRRLFTLTGELIDYFGSKPLALAMCSADGRSN